MFLKGRTAGMPDARRWSVRFAVPATRRGTGEMTKRIGLGMVAVAAFMAIAAPSQGQRQRIYVEPTKVRAEKLRAPIYQIRGAQPLRSTRAWNWMRIRVDYETYVEWLDGLKIRAYVLARSDEGATVVLTGEVEYLNVPEGKHMAVLFVHPNTVYRYGGDKGKGIERVAIEMILGNTVVARMGTEGPLAQPWWQGLPQVNQVVDRDHTPFSLYYADAVEQIKR